MSILELLICFRFTENANILRNSLWLVIFSPVVWLHVLNRLEDLPKPPFPVCYVNCSIDHVQIEMIKTRKRSDKKNTEEQSRHAFHSVNIDLSVRSDATVRFWAGSAPGVACRLSISPRAWSCDLPIYIVICANQTRKKSSSFLLTSFSFELLLVDTPTWYFLWPWH